MNAMEMLLVDERGMIIDSARVENMVEIINVIQSWSVYIDIGYTIEFLEPDS